MQGNGPIRVVAWSQRTEPQRVYPEAINGAIAGFLNALPGFAARAVYLQDPEQGLSEEVLAATDVLFWWGHGREHDYVTDEHVARVVRHVRQRGMGFVALHSSHHSKPFKALVEDTGDLGGWREDGRPTRVYTVAPAHPIARGVPNVFVIPQEEMYCEPFGIPAPHDLVFVSWFPGGEVFRSGCCWEVGRGRVFYFQPGHETYPVYQQPAVLQVIENAARWAACGSATTA